MINWSTNQNIDQKLIASITKDLMLTQIKIITDEARESQNLIHCAAAVITINEWVNAFVARNNNGGNNAA